MRTAFPHAMFLVSWTTCSRGRQFCWEIDSPNSVTIFMRSLPRPVGFGLRSHDGLRLSIVSSNRVIERVLDEQVLDGLLQCFFIGIFLYVEFCIQIFSRLRREVTNNKIVAFLSGFSGVIAPRSGNFCLHTPWFSNFSFIFSSKSGSKSFRNPLKFFQKVTMVNFPNVNFWKKLTSGSTQISPKSKSWLPEAIDMCLMFWFICSFGCSKLIVWFKSPNAV